jgi:integrase
VPRRGAVDWNYWRDSARTLAKYHPTLVLLSREVLKQPDLAFGDFARARHPRRLPTVLETSEVAAVLGCLERTQRLMIGLMYGTGNLPEATESSNKS